MKIAMATTAVSLIGIAGVMYATQRKRRRTRFAFLSKLI
jgi:hypothetical protein